jgi:hypothetical protein
MKTKEKTFAMLIGLGLLLWLNNSGVAAQEEFEKNVEKTYTVNKNSRFSIENKYGDIDMRDWNENKIKIEARIIIRDVSKQKVDKLFNEVTIEISQTDDLVEVKTNYSREFFDLVGKDFQNNKKFEVKYLIMLPADLKVDAKNKYGDMFVSKLTSASTLRIDYGTLKINQLLAPDNNNMAEIDLSYSKGTIENAEWLSVISKYSKLVIENSKALVVVSRYSKLSVENGSSLVSDSKYDTYEIGKISNFVTESQYSNIKIDELYNKVALDTKYTDVRVDYLAASFETIDIDNSYGSIRLGIDPSASYSLSGNAKYAKITYPDNSRVNRFQENTEMRVDGNVGNAEKPKAKVKIETNYGGVNLTQ